jgi:hypothetical protein
MLTAKITIGSSREKEALINLGSELNLLSNYLAKELQLPITLLTQFCAEAANGLEMSIIGATTVEVAITDLRGRARH